MWNYGIFRSAVIVAKHLFKTNCVAKHLLLVKYANAENFYGKQVEINETRVAKLTLRVCNVYNGNILPYRKSFKLTDIFCYCLSDLL